MSTDKHCKQEVGIGQESLIVLREAITQAVEQMDYCDKDGRPQSLCPCCFQKVRGMLVGALNEVPAPEEA